MEENTVNKGSNATTKRLTYKELEDTCNRLVAQNRSLIDHIQSLNASNMFKRLDYLFKVLEYSQVIGDPEFVGNCVDEIKEAMTIPAREEQDTAHGNTNEQE